MTTLAQSERRGQSGSASTDDCDPHGLTLAFLGPEKFHYMD